MSLNRRIDKENLVHLCNGIVFSMKNKDIMNFVGKCMGLETIMLSEVTQTQKDMHGIYSLTRGYKP